MLLSIGLALLGVAVGATLNDTRSCPPGTAAFAVGDQTYCTHGGDPLPYGVDPDDRPAPEPHDAAPVPCIGTGTDGKRIESLYLWSDENRFPVYASSFQTWIAEANQIYTSASAGQRQLRFTTDAGCRPTIKPIQVNPVALDSLQNTISALQSLGYAKSDRKYLIFAESGVYCGIGTVLEDDSPGPTNRNNSGPSYARVDTPCWSGHTAAHELTHNLGGVQMTAPNASGGWHCTDEYDLMCYSDSPNYPSMHIACSNYAADNRLDCNNDDYFALTPTGWLAQHWNVANSGFLVNVTPAPTVTPSPAPTVTPTPRPASIRVSPIKVRLGGSLKITLRGFAPGSTVHLALAGRPLASVVANTLGDASLTVALPRTTMPGLNTLVARGTVTVSTQITVTR